MPADASLEGSGRAMHGLIRELFPICRSITGDGFRDSLRGLSKIAPIVPNEIPSGTRVFDWTVPKEWNIRDAWIADRSGRRWVDFRESNLHVVNYSIPVRTRMPLAELRRHLHALPDQPDLIPYRTSYYAEDWGFCLSQRILDQLPDGEYEVCIDSTLVPGNLTYGECLLHGTIPDEILISVHSCHPSLANDNLSGMVVAAFLARHLASQPRRHTFRFLFIPGTIGSITWLALHETEAGNIRHGLVLSCLGDPGPLTYKRSRRGNAPIDRATAHVLRDQGGSAVREFTPYGYDERQYCSPGFNLAVGCLMRTPNGQFPEYHTSADNLNFVRAESLEGSLRKVLEIIAILEHDTVYVNLNPKCEPQLGRRGLYDTKGGTAPPDLQMAMLWVLNLSDGNHRLIEIAQRAALPFGTIRHAAIALHEAGLLRLAHDTKSESVAPTAVLSQSSATESWDG
jgi:aminopeptidase-like protein